MNDAQRLLERAETLLTRLENHLPLSPPDWSTVYACRWRKHSGHFQPIHYPHQIRLSDLLQKQQIDQNTQQFLRKHPANNVLLWGARGTGKSSLVKALLNEYASAGFRLVEIEKFDLVDIIEIFYQRPERFIIFCDDLSFEPEDASYLALKSVPDGSLSAPPENILIYATSNQRHLLPDSEAVEAKISLSDRFGLWLSFYPFTQEEYLTIVSYWLPKLGTLEAHQAALQWALLPQWVAICESRDEL